MSVQNKLWTEKHRPETLDDIVGHEKSVERLKEYAKDGQTPHMIFAGPPGTGKTAAVTAFAREVYGDNWSNNVTEMNASDERGIDTIRDKVKGVARSNPAGNADYQIIFMDEFDQMTKDAQAALRRIMEQYSDVTRFFLSCNYKNQIIDAIQSRCSDFRFGRLHDQEVSQIIENVAVSENLKIGNEAIERLVNAVDGDARTAINTLQSSAMEGEVTVDSVENVVGVVRPEIVEDIVDLAIAGKADPAMEKLDQELLKEGANTKVMADSFLRVIQAKDIPAPGKIKILDKLAECDWRVRQGSNPQVQWHSFVADITAAYHLNFGGKYEPEGNQ